MHNIVKKIKTGIVIVLAFVSVVWQSRAQDPIFSQFHSSPLQINPAFTGYSEGGVLGINYRNQWPSISQAYVTYAMYYDQYISKINSGFGVQLLADNAALGFYKTTKITGMYSYKQRFSKKWFGKLGVEAGVISSNIGWDKLVFPDMIDPIYGYLSPGGLPYPTSVVPPDQLSQLNMTVSLGGLVYNDKFFIGFSAKHINTPTISFYDTQEVEGTFLPVRMSIQAGYEIVLDENVSRSKNFLTPTIVAIKQGNVGQVNMGAHLRLNNLLLGTYYRQAFSNPDAVILMAGVQTNDMKIVYSFDMTVSKLTLGSGGAHEIGMVFTFNTNKNNKYVDCLNFIR